MGTRRQCEELQPSGFVQKTRDGIGHKADTAQVLKLTGSAAPSPPMPHQSTSRVVTQNRFGKPVGNQQ